MTTFDHEVIVVGAGPTGLMLAAELVLAGVDVGVVERRPDQHVDSSRAGGLYPRTLEVLDQRGVADRFVSAGTTIGSAGFALVVLDVTDLPTRFPFVLALWQRDFEPILADWVAELGVTVRRSNEVTDVVASPDHVEVALADGTTLRAQYVVGCDGGRSVVRRAAGIEAVGADPTTSWLIAEVDLDGDPEYGMRYDDAGHHGLSPLGPDGPVRVLITERELHRGDQPDLGELRRALVEVYGTDHGLRDARWISRFTDMTRQAVDYRRGRVLLAGDAAHTHPPHGGQGLNTGVQDAVNLGWKLAQVVHGTSGEELLDTYQRERHPVAARVLRNTLAQVALGRPDVRSKAAHQTVTELLATDEARVRTASMVTALDLRYGIDGGGSHPLVGHRIPDLDLTTVDGPTRIAQLLRDARPLLLSFGPGTVSDPEVPDRVSRIGAAAGPTCELPVVGRVDLPPAVLVRPDGHVAWAGDLDDPALATAAGRWFGRQTSGS